METQIIQIYVDDEGNVIYHVKGIPGGGCESILDMLDELFAGESETDFTDEYFGGAGTDGAQKIAW